MVKESTFKVSFCNASNRVMFYSLLDGSWFVGDTNGTQLEVFGWKFSDQNTFYPNVSRLHIVGTGNLVETLF